MEAGHFFWRAVFVSPPFPLFFLHSSLSTETFSEGAKEKGVCGGEAEWRPLPAVLVDFLHETEINLLPRSDRPGWGALFAAFLFSVFGSAVGAPVVLPC